MNCSFKSHGESFLMSTTESSHVSPRAMEVSRLKKREVSAWPLRLDIQIVLASRTIDDGVRICAHHLMKLSLFSNRIALHHESLVACLPSRDGRRRLVRPVHQRHVVARPKLAFRIHSYGVAQQWKGPFVRQ